MRKKGRILALALSMLMLCSCGESDRSDRKKSSLNDKLNSSMANMSELYRKVCNYQIYSYWCKNESEFGFYDVVENKYYPISSLSYEIDEISYNGFISFCEYDDWYGGKYGFMNSDGEIVIEAQYAEVRPFTESGLSAVAKGLYTGTSDDLYGYINTDGEYVIEPKYEEVTNFSKDGIAFVILPDSNKGNYIDTEGNVISKLEKFDYKNSQTFSEYGVAFTGITDENTYGLIDTKGNWIYKFEANYSVDCIYHGDNYYTFSYDDNDFLVCGDGKTINLQEKGWGIIEKSTVKDNRLVALDDYTRNYVEVNLKTEELESISKEFKSALTEFDTYYQEYYFNMENYLEARLNGYYIDDSIDYSDGHGHIVDINKNVVTEKDAEYSLVEPYSLECW